MLRGLAESLAAYGNQRRDSRQGNRPREPAPRSSLPAQSSVMVIIVVLVMVIIVVIVMVIIVVIAIMLQMARMPRLDRRPAADRRKSCVREAANKYGAIQANHEEPPSRGAVQDCVLTSLVPPIAKSSKPP